MRDTQDRSGGLLAWQWALYPEGHTTRSNLLIHIVTVPIFEMGTLLLLSGLRTGLGYAITGLLMMVGAMACQGRGHAGEPNRPVPFLGPLDVFARILSEQWIAFPRFVIRGGFGRAWIAAGPRPPA